MEGVGVGGGGCTHKSPPAVRLALQCGDKHERVSMLVDKCRMLHEQTDHDNTPANLLHLITFIKIIYSLLAHLIIHNNKK